MTWGVSTVRAIIIYKNYITVSDRWLKHRDRYLFSGTSNISRHTERHHYSWLTLPVKTIRKHVWPCKQCVCLPRTRWKDTFVMWLDFDLNKLRKLIQYAVSSAFAFRCCCWLLWWRSYHNIHQELSQQMFLVPKTFHLSFIYFLRVCWGSWRNCRVFVSWYTLCLAGYTLLHYIEKS